MFIYQIKADNLVTRYEFSKKAAIAAMETLSEYGVCSFVDRINLKELDDEEMSEIFEDTFTERCDLINQVASVNWD